MCIICDHPPTHPHLHTHSPYPFHPHPSQALLSRLGPFHPVDSLTALMCLNNLANHITVTNDAKLALGERGQVICFCGWAGGRWREEGSPVKEMPMPICSKSGRTCFGVIASSAPQAHAPPAGQLAVLLEGGVLPAMVRATDRLIDNEETGHFIRGEHQLNGHAAVCDARCCAQH